MTALTFLELGNGIAQVLLAEIGLKTLRARERGGRLALTAPAWFSHGAAASGRRYESLGFHDQGECLSFQAI